MIKAKRLVGNTEIVATSDTGDVKEDILRVSWLTNAPEVCGLCNSPKLILHSRSVNQGEFTFAEFQCSDCLAKVSLGEHKSPKGALFVKKDWSKFEKKDANS